LSWDGILNKNILSQDVINIISPLFFQNIKSNPCYRQYMTIFEQSNEFNNMCILSLDVVDEMIKKHNISNNEFGSIHVTIEIQNLSLLFYLRFDSQHPMTKIFFIMGNMTKRLHKNEVCH